MPATAVAAPALDVDAARGLHDDVAATAAEAPRAGDVDGLRRRALYDDDLLRRRALHDDDLLRLRLGHDDDLLRRGLLHDHHRRRRSAHPHASAERHLRPGHGWKRH